MYDLLPVTIWQHFFSTATEMESWIRIRTKYLRIHNTAPDKTRTGTLWQVIYRIGYGKAQNRQVTVVKWIIVKWQKSVKDDIGLIFL